MTEKAAPPPSKPLTPQEWETLIEDFQFSGEERRQNKWSSLPSLFDQLLNSVLRKDFPLSVKVPTRAFSPTSLATCGACGRTNEHMLHKELRKALAFLLELPQILTPCGMEFMAMVIPVAAALEIQP
ncbi:hypothetical protein HN51_010343 [Arachis hypogaea]